MNIYEIRRYGTVVFLLISVAAVTFFLYFSNSLVEELSEQEHSRMKIWADATRKIAGLGMFSDGEMADADIDFLLGIIEGNRSIPVLLTDDNGSIIMHRNFDLPEPVDSLRPLYISDRNAAYLNKKLEQLRHSPNVIHILISPGHSQHLYYEDSNLLKSLSLYPYVQLVVMGAFLFVVYYAVSSTKKAEQNKVWVGLSKETAHQLGTPISSLMAWIELLESDGTDPEIVSEMGKDVRRLSTVASRFSKIGSRPTLEAEDINEVVSRCASYMATRISSQIKLTVNESSESLNANLSAPLIEWVMENLIKNAVDAMESSGSITIDIMGDKDKGIVEVKDSGKGMPRKMHKAIFNPGYTTKKRGWGLGLTLAKRIVAQYHGGTIYVKHSEPGQGTTFRLELPLIQKPGRG